MAGETQRTHAVKELDAGSKLQDEGTALEQQSDKTTKESSEHFSSTGTEVKSTNRGAKAEKLEKERECPQQREAVIRPQQAGKIDFKSLQNRSKFASERTWSSGKGSPQSPSGKGRSREKGKRAGKTERGNPQQLYRLSITNSRSNPTIGIAYPQQKVPPPKTLDASRGPVSGSYRFHVPSIPEREAELQQEELSYSRCFQEASANITSPSYTSQALGSSSGTSSHPHPPLPQQQQQQQQPAPMENSTQASSQLILTDFQLNSNAWQPAEKTFNGANYGVSSQKSTEANKTFVPSLFQYGYHFLEESASDSFACEQNAPSQDITDSNLSSVHVTHNSFTFAPGDGQNIVQNNTQFSNDQRSEDRASYPHPPQSQFIEGVASSMQYPRNLSEDSTSSDSSGSVSQQSEQGKTALPESTDHNGQVDSRDAAITSGSKRSCHPKDTDGNQRSLIQGSVHHARNMSQGAGSQMHFSNKTFTSPPASNIHTGPMSFDKNMSSKVLNRLPRSWEGPNKTYSSADQSTIQYTDMNDRFQFQNQSGLDQRPNISKNSRMPWQQIRPNSAMQNRIELSRQASSQKLAYMVAPSDWQDDSKSLKHISLKTPSSFQNSRSGDGFANQRQDSVKHSNNTVSTFKVEMSHAQMCESKNKAVFFGLNQSLSAATRNYGYLPSQVPPMGLMMVSPYESPLPSPVHNPTPGSTCSSLSPASTSPVNISSEDSQVSKSAPPHTFYHQPQAKAQLPSDHLSSHTHQFQSDASRNLPYAPEKVKDDMMAYLQNNNGTHPKTTMEGSKGYMDSFGVEHHQPPPPYSSHAHQLLATSLATANLDQLDVLLTCKQCDQNFHNLASFLSHKQYCTQHTFAQNDLKDISKMEDTRKLHAEPAKVVSSAPNVSMSRCPSDLHLSLLGLNKNGELLSDSDTKGDTKDDPMKLSLFSSAGILPELEMEDAKLDSLITEALNGLGYQSDNAEIDSSFIDAFADDDLTTVKATSSKQCQKSKESLVFESKNKPAASDDRSSMQGKYFYDSDVESPETDKQYTESKLEKISLNLEQDEKINIKKEVSHKNSRNASREKTREQDSKVKEGRKLCKSEDENMSTQRILLSSKFSERCGVKSFQDSSALRGSTPSQASTSPTSRTAVKESKRKNTGGGTWSKELIHKIVQQKNKLHKLHVKGTKNLQFSLVMERLPPTVQNPAFVEYDYVSDSDDECEPVKIASQGRLNQSSRCKYTYTKECKWRARSERDQAAWRHESKECFEVKKSEEVSLSPEKHGSHQRLRRRGSRSSTSSELSTSVSVSSDSVNSPKSIDRADSDCERKTDVIKKESPERRTYERSSPQKLCKESSTLALTFTKSVKKYNADKGVFPDDKEAEDPKKCFSHADVTDSASSSQKAKDTMRNVEKSRSSHTKSREKLVPHKKEICAAGGIDRNAPQRASSLCPTEPARCNSADTKPLQYDSPSAATDREPDFNMDRSTKAHQKEEPRVAQPEPSDRAAFDKHGDSVCLVKETIAAATGLDAHKPASLCASLMDEVCLSPCESQGPLIQKDTLHLMPYPLDQEQGLMKSPLSFDTSSMFGDLTGFDSGIYSDMPIQKEGFHSMESTADKKEEFVSSFSPFLEQRDWNLIVSPVLPDEISQYKGNAEKSNEKKPDYSHVPLSLPEKIIDYSANLTSCASEHELEIKRIVNELENQLQTTKLESPPLLAQDPPKQLQMSKFSPLRLGDESEIEDAGLDVRCPVQTIDVPVTRIPPQPFAEQALPWSSPFQFEIMGAHHSPHTPIHSEPEALERFTEKEDDAPHLIGTTPQLRDQKSGEKDAENEAPTETKEDILEQKRYTENLIKSLEVISDSIFKKDATGSEPKEVNVTSLTSQQRQEIECQAADAVEREDHSEKEAITRKENILPPPNINERKDDIAFILNESQSSLRSGTDPTVDGNQPISTQPSEPSESNNSQAETPAAPKEDITESNNLIEPARCSSAATHDPHVAEESCRSNAAGENLNGFKADSDGRELLNTDDYKEAEVVRGDAGQAGEKDFGGGTAGEMQERPTDKRAEPGGTGSSRPGELTVEQSDTLNGAVETKRDHLIGLSPINYCSPAKFYPAASPATDMSVEIVTTDKPCSPILVETNTESDGQCSAFQDTQVMEGRSDLLILPPSDSDSCKVTPTNDSPKLQAGLSFDTIDKREEILNVQDIKEQLPVDFMASHQNSPCGKEPEQSHCLFLNSAPLSSPLLAASPQTPIKTLALEEMSCQPQSKCSDVSMDQSSVQNVTSPLNKEGNHDVKEALRSNEQLSTTVEMEYSLINPPHLELGIIECKIPGSNITSHSPRPVSGAAEPAKLSEGLEKREPMYEFKLSPFHYNSISDEHPPANQYDYIPISPASKPEENADIDQSSRDDCEPCDLSINPALIFDKAETRASLNPDPTGKLNLSAQPLILQQSMKFTYFLPAEIQSTSSSARGLKKDLEICHVPFEPAEHLHTCTDLQEKVEAVNIEPHKDLAEDRTLLKKDISDGPPTPKLLVICENEQMPLPLHSSEKQTTIETGQCSATQQIHKEMSPQKTQSNAQQGKVLCEICFMCFRTVPGLKRHKAMKHLVRAEKHIGSQSTSNHRGTILIYEASQTTEKEHKDDSQTCYQTKIDGLPDTSSTLTSKAAETESVMEEMAAETSAAAVDEVVHQNPPPPTKAKKINKARKNKNSEVNIKRDPFPDEILDLLKTDILQAITPDFKRSGQQGEQSSTDDQVKVSDGAETEELPHSLTSSSSFDCTPLPPATETNVLNETMEELNQIADVEEMKCMSTTETANGPLRADDNVGSAISAKMDIIGEGGDSRSTDAAEEMREQEQSEESLAQEILRQVAVEIKCEKNGVSPDRTQPLSCLSSSPLSRPSVSPDLNALLDDDATFSQLFPRDDEAKRKKCPRVYSKRNKRHKLSHNLDVTRDNPSSESFGQHKDQYVEKQAAQTLTDSQANHCGYETISIDDAIMLNMCYNSTVKEDAKLLPDAKQGKVNQDVEENINELGINPHESTVDKSSIEWSDSNDFSFFDTEATLSCDTSTKLAASATPSPVAHHGEPSVTESVQSFHSIDIQAINTTFQLPDIQFFDSNKEIAVAPPAAAAESRDDDKSKGATERRGRKRQDAGMKVKDKQYKCKVCFTWFLTLGELNFHKLSHNPSPPPTCYMCVQRKFSSREQLRDHLREKHAKNKTGIWTCGMCLKEISDVWMYNEHLREHATQFARRGQTQGSMLDIPGCFMQETAVKNFITSIMQHRPSKSSRDSSKAAKEQEKGVAADSAAREGKTPEPAESRKAKNNGGAGGKQASLTPLEVLHKTETPKVIEMHPNCKDPSRDCHHCGKQFPKPFKLQRHLVVHNLEKIFLCHKCPVSYQEAQALKDHLKRAHEEVEELDSKHTILYTCELCADVMHVIKKSFICSTCNYTFSKKEQFDRHMEKHLSGGNKIFKFRGVVRPAKASASREDEGDAPAGKKRRTFSDSLQENSSDSGIASVSSLHLSQSGETRASKAFVATAEDSTQTVASECHGDGGSTNVKKEDVAEDYTELLVELEKCIHMGSSESAAPKEEEIEPIPSPNPDEEGSVKSIIEPCDVKEENESVCIRAEANSRSKESSGVGEEVVKAVEGSAEGDTAEMEVKTDVAPPAEESFVILRENLITSKTPESAKHHLVADVTDQQMDDGKESKETSNDNQQQPEPRDAEQVSGQVREKLSTTSGGTKAPDAAPVLHAKACLNASVSNEDKESPRPQKKRKEMKSPNSLQRASPPTQENMDSRAKKKFRPSKCTNPSLQRKPDGANDYPVLSSVRDDVVSNKLVNKCKASNLGLQSKRSLLDICTQKKAELVTPLNGDYKTKKGTLGRPLHSSISKVSSVPMNNSLNKSRPKMGVRSMESHSYRTAESQNHLLSQLFGQKLTSFKIPLRKDTSESIN